MEKMFIDLTTGKIILSYAGGLNSQYHGWRNAQYPEGLYYSNGQLYALSLDEFVARFGSWNPVYHPRFYLSEDLPNHKAWALEYINIASSPAGKECVFEFCYGDRRYAILINMQRQERAWPKFNAIDDASLINLRRKLTDISIDIAPMLDTHWKPLTINAFNDDTISGTISNEINKAQRKMMEEILLKEGYHGGFTTQTVYSAQQIAEMFDNANKNKKETKTMNKMDRIDEFYKHHTIYVHENEIWFTYNNGDKASSIIVADKDGAKILKEHRDEFILMLYQLHITSARTMVIFIPSERKTIFKDLFLNKETVIKDSSKKKFDYIQAFFIGLTKFKLNATKTSVGYNWYDKLTNHRKIKEV